MWCSLVACTAGGRVVAGSNPVIPTNEAFKAYQIIANAMIYKGLDKLGV